MLLLFFFFNDTPTPEIYTLPLHDALPISALRLQRGLHRRSLAPRAADRSAAHSAGAGAAAGRAGDPKRPRSEEHTSELQSRLHLVCRLLLEKKKKITLIKDYPYTS